MIQRFYGIVVILLSAFYLGACVDAPALEPLLAYDAAAGMAYGQRGPWGVGLYERTFRVRVKDTVEALVTVPLTANGDFSSMGYPLVVFVHGGLVPPERYLWLMQHISSRGFIVMAPKHLGDLAFFAQGNALDLTEAMHQASHREGDLFYRRLPNRPGLILGHSLGGVVASSAWLDAPSRFSHLALLASEPNPGDDLGARQAQEGPLKARVLSVTGSRDKLQPPADAMKGARAFEDAGFEVTLATALELNHYQWTQDYTVDEIAKDSSPILSDEVAQLRAMWLVDAMLDELALGQRLSTFDDPQTWGAGLEAYETYCAREEAQCQ